MRYHDNPAGRLHDVLSRLGEQNHKDTLLNGWAAVFDVPADDVFLRLGPVAELWRQTQEEVERNDEDPMPDLVERYRASWAYPIFPRNVSFESTLNEVYPETASLEGLAAVSALLHRIAPEGEIPDEGQLTNIKSQLRDVIDSVSEADDITDEMRRLLIERLRGVEEAVEHLSIGGPNAIRLATEAALGSAVIRAREEAATDDEASKPDVPFWETETFVRVRTILEIVWIGFTAGPQVQDSLGFWEGLPQLGPAVERSADQSKTAPKTPPEKSAEPDGPTQDKADSAP